MGIRGELYSTRVSTEGRTYFFNVKENRMGDVFLTIVESKPTEADNFDRRSIVIFRDDMRDFLKAFQGALSFLEKPGTGSGGKGADALRFDGTARKRTEERHPLSHAGFVGADGPAEQSPAAKKRRLVVKKRGASESRNGSGTPPDPEGDTGSSEL